MDATHDRHLAERPGVLPPRGPLRDAGDLERRVRARRAVVDRRPGPRQRQPRLRRHEHVQRHLAVQPVAPSATSSRWSARRAASSPATATPTGTSPGATGWRAAPSRADPGGPRVHLPACARAVGHRDDRRTVRRRRRAHPRPAGARQPHAGRCGRRRGRGRPAVRAGRRDPAARPTTGPTGPASCSSACTTWTRSLADRGAGLVVRRGDWVARGGRASSSRPVPPACTWPVTSPGTPAAGSSRLAARLGDRRRAGGARRDAVRGAAG